jgi:hypothetical protein
VGAAVEKCHPALGEEVIMSLGLLLPALSRGERGREEELIRYHNTGRQVESKKIT